MLSTSLDGKSYWALQLSLPILKPRKWMGPFFGICPVIGAHAESCTVSCV